MMLRLGLDLDDPEAAELVVADARAVDASIAELARRERERLG
ncbi:hypothetical protein [Sorangium cellulosum]|nr:hypothetical protein [Sorangium cellulosum]